MARVGGASRYETAMYSGGRGGATQIGPTIEVAFRRIGILESSALRPADLDHFLSGLSIRKRQFLHLGECIGIRCGIHIGG